MSCSGDYSREGLVGNRTEVGHSEAEGAQGSVELVEGDARFGYDETLFSVDLFGGRGNAEKEGSGRLPVSDRA